MVIDEIAAERARQINVEGWSSDHDDHHDDGSLALAACCYAAPILLKKVQTFADGFSVVDPWPWAGRFDKRYGKGSSRRGEKDDGANYHVDPATYNAAERRDLLVKAGALIVAEIERLDRAAPPPSPGACRE